MESLRPRRIGEFVEILWRKKGLLALMSLAVLMASLFVIKRLPNVYESSSTIVIGQQASEEQRVQQSPRYSALLDQMISRDSVSQLIRKYDLYPEIKVHEYKIAAFQKDLKDLKASTKIRDFFPQVPESLRITYRYNDPTKAQQVVTELTNAFLQANSQLKQEAAADARRIEGKIVETVSQIKALGPQKDADMLRFEMLANRPSDTSVLSAMTARNAAEQSLETLQDDKTKLELQIQLLQNQIADQEKVAAQAASIPTAASSAAVGTLLGKKVEITSRIETNQAKGWLDKHPEQVRLRTELAQLERQIALLESSPNQNSSAQKLLLPEFRELRKMQNDLTGLSTQLEVVNIKIKNKSENLRRLPVPDVTARQALPGPPTSNPAVKTEYEQLLTQYQWLLTKRDELEKMANSDTSSALMYQVTEQPNRPNFPAAPNKLMLMALGLGLALAFGLIVAFGTEVPRFFQINDERDIEYYLGAPVLAAIPETLTPIERSHKRKLKMTRGILVLMLVGALIPTFVVVLNTLKIFQVLGNK